MEQTSLTAVSPVDIKIIEQRADGSGVVELPILSEQAKIDLARTATEGGTGTDSITAEDLRQAVVNFAQWPGPVPVHRYPHRSMSETAGPAEGFVESLHVRGNQLWARIDLTAQLFAEVKGRMWRGFSVDYGRGATLPSKKLSGFLVAGGVFTNRPASDVHFRVAAATGVDCDLSTIFVPIEARESETTGDHNMTVENKDLTVSLATAEAEVKLGRDKIVSLEARLQTGQQDLIEKEKERAAAVRQLDEARTELNTAKLSVDRLTHQATEDRERIEQLDAERKELKAKLSTQEDDTIRREVTSMCRGAVREGVPPAMLAAFGDYEKDPKKWAENFASLDAAKVFVKTLPRDAALSRLSSGRGKAGDDDSAASGMDKGRLDNLKSLGLDPNLASVRNESELRDLIDAGKVKAGGAK